MTAWGGRKAAEARAYWISQMYAQGGAPCAKCGKWIDPLSAWDVGHQVMRIHGGSDSINNTAPEHTACAEGARYTQSIKTKKNNSDKRIRPW